MRKVAFACLLAGCGAVDEPSPPPSSSAATVLQGPAGFLSVSGSTEDDVWVVGSNRDGAPAALRWRRGAWEAPELPAEGVLWWVHALADGTTFLGGERGMLLVHRPGGGGIERLETPALARQTVFGVYARSPDDVYAVGGIGSRSGFVWHYDGTAIRELPLPSTLPLLSHGGTAALFKVVGAGDDTWFVGGLGQVLVRRGDGPIEALGPRGDEPLLTVAAGPSGVLAVGGAQRGRIEVLAPRGESLSQEDWPLLQGVAVGPDGAVYASGAGGTMLLRRPRSSAFELYHPTEEPIPGESLHAIWVAPDRAVWAVGGDVLSARLDRGVIVYAGPNPPSPLPAVVPPAPAVGCTEAPPDTDNVARFWNEMALSAVRRSLPEPTVHARNLYHLALALHDAWAAFEPEVPGLVVDEALTEGRAEAMSHAAFRLLSHRYRDREGGVVSLACFFAGFSALGLDETSETPAAMAGRRIGQAIVDGFAVDGSLEHLDYQDPRYRPRNPPLVADDPGIEVDDIDTWQPLDLAVAVTQNGIPERSGPQNYIGPHWGEVTPFSIRRPQPHAPYFDAGERPSLSDPRMGAWVLDVLRRTAALDVDDGVTMDISPGAYGNEGRGHPLNPHTGSPYEPQVVLRGDFGRVLAEHWADGPDSETPPGHWNVLAHRAFDHPEFRRRLFGEGPELDPVTWEVLASLVLNGALHDAAIVGWEVKRDYETARPISLIRYMGQRGQSSDPSLPRFDRLGLPLEPGLVELITEASADPGARHDHLGAHIGEIAVWSWPGDPGDEERQRSRFRWIRAVEWVPYQPRTFVTPAFPGFVSGHSTFSRTAAEVLTALTGTPFVPGGSMGQRFLAGRGLEFEFGPSAEVRLEFATWRDASDQAGVSRIWGGIHVAPDDIVGRLLGERVAASAVAWARARFSGRAPLPTVPVGAGPVPGPEPEPDPPFPEPIDPGLDPGCFVGTGRDRFLPLSHGDPLRWEAGVQGGFHAWLSARVLAREVESLSEGERREIRTRFVLARASGEILAEINRTGGFRTSEGGEDLYGNFAVLRPGLRPSRLDGAPLRLEVSVQAPGLSLGAAVWVRSDCCD